MRKRKSIFRVRTAFFIPANQKNKIEKKWVGAGIIVGRFGNKCALAHIRASYFEVSLGDMRPVQQPAWPYLARWGVNVTYPTYRIHNTLSSGFEIDRLLNENAHRIHAGKPNRVGKYRYAILLLKFYETDLQRRIDIRELRWGFNDFVNHLGNTEELKREKGRKKPLRSRNH